MRLQWELLWAILYLFNFTIGSSPKDELRETNHERALLKCTDVGDRRKEWTKTVIMRNGYPEYLGDMCIFGCYLNQTDMLKDNKITGISNYLWILNQRLKLDDSIVESVDRACMAEFSQKQADKYDCEGSAKLMKCGAEGLYQALSAQNLISYKEEIKERNVQLAEMCAPKGRNKKLKFTMVTREIRPDDADNKRIFRCLFTILGIVSADSNELFPDMYTKYGLGLIYENGEIQPAYTENDVSECTPTYTKQKEEGRFGKDYIKLPNLKPEYESLNLRNCLLDVRHEHIKTPAERKMHIQNILATVGSFCEPGKPGLGEMLLKGADVKALDKNFYKCALIRLGIIDLDTTLNTDKIQTILKDYYNIDEQNIGVIIEAAKQKFKEDFPTGSLIKSINISKFYELFDLLMKEIEKLAIEDNATQKFQTQLPLTDDAALGAPQATED